MRHPLTLTNQLVQQCFTCLSQSTQLASDTKDIFDTAVQVIRQNTTIWHHTEPCVDLVSAIVYLCGITKDCESFWRNLCCVTSIFGQTVRKVVFLLYSNNMSTSKSFFINIIAQMLGPNLSSPISDTVINARNRAMTPERIQASECIMISFEEVVGGASAPVNAAVLRQLSCRAWVMVKPPRSVTGEIVKFDCTPVIATNNNFKLDYPDDSLVERICIMLCEIQFPVSNTLYLHQCKEAIDNPFLAGQTHGVFNVTEQQPFTPRQRGDIVMGMFLLVMTMLRDNVDGGDHRVKCIDPKLAMTRRDLNVKRLIYAMNDKSIMAFVKAHVIPAKEGWIRITDLDASMLRFYDGTHKTGGFSFLKFKDAALAIMEMKFGACSADIDLVPVLRGITLC